MLFQIKSYLKFLWHSKNEHAVHSPFVFNLITKCFYDTTEKTEYKLLSDYRRKMLLDNRTISVTDYGAGSKIFKSNERVVSQIAKNAGISRKRSRLLFRISRYFKAETMLEIGTSLGLGTIALATGNTNAAITSLEGCPETSAIAKRQLQQFGCEQVTTLITEFKTYLTTHLAKGEVYQLIYFDGNHQKEATLDYFNLLLPTITNDTVWIFDDIHWSEEMEVAWETIKKHPQVTVTIDTFQWGVVFFRKEQPKEHFIIRV